LRASKEIDKAKISVEYEQPRVKAHQKHIPAKGLAMKTGLRGAFERSAEIIVFVDADISNITPEWVDKLVQALIDDNCDIRGFYTRHSQEMQQLQS
jgi:hypothetical protein